VTEPSPPPLTPPCSGIVTAVLCNVRMMHRRAGREHQLAGDIEAHEPAFSQAQRDCDGTPAGVAAQSVELIGFLDFSSAT